MVWDHYLKLLDLSFENLSLNVHPELFLSTQFQMGQHILYVANPVNFPEYWAKICCDNSIVLFLKK